MNHKLSFTFLIFQFFLINVIDAQTVGIGTSSPNTSAMLDLSSTVSGLLIPRMTTAQQNAIPAITGGTVAAPAIGLMLYNTSTNTINANIGTVAAPTWSSLWGTGGDNLTNSGNQFLGTTNGIALRFRTNNLERMVIDSTTGYVGINLPSISTTSNSVTTTAGGIPNSTLQVNGSFATEIRLLNAQGTYVAANQNLFLINESSINASTSPINITLPTAASSLGRKYTFKVTAGYTTKALITIHGAVVSTVEETIESSNTGYTLLNASYKYLSIQSDGSKWYILGSN